MTDNTTTHSIERRSKPRPKIGLTLDAAIDRLAAAIHSLRIASEANDYSGRIKELEKKMYSSPAKFIALWVVVLLLMLVVMFQVKELNHAEVEIQLLRLKTESLQTQIVKLIEKEAKRL